MDVFNVTPLNYFFIVNVYKEIVLIPICTEDMGDELVQDGEGTAGTGGGGVDEDCIIIKLYHN